MHAAPAHAHSSYESPVIESSYQPYTPSSGVIMGGGTTEGTIIHDGGTITDGVPLEGGSLQGGSLGTETIIDSARYKAAKPAIENDTAVLTVSVPLDARVTVNGHKTSSAGTVRQFKSRGLKEGYVYTYVVKATYQVGGEEKTESKSVKLRPGDVESVEFTTPEPAKAAEKKAAEPKPNDVVTVVRLASAS